MNSFPPSEVHFHKESLRIRAYYILLYAVNLNVHTRTFPSFHLDEGPVSLLACMWLLGTMPVLLNCVRYVSCSTSHKNSLLTGYQRLAVHHSLSRRQPPHSWMGEVALQHLTTAHIAKAGIVVAGNRSNPTRSL